MVSPSLNGSPATSEWNESHRRLPLPCTFNTVASFFIRYQHSHFTEIKPNCLSFPEYALLFYATGPLYVLFSASPHSPLPPPATSHLAFKPYSNITPSRSLHHFSSCYHHGVVMQVVLFGSPTHLQDALSRERCPQHQTWHPVDTKCLLNWQTN